MSIWYAIPSCRPQKEAQECLNRWGAMGYRVAVLRQGEPVACNLWFPADQYLGWAQSINILAKHIIERDPDAEWIVSGGDDYLPDAAHWPEQIAAECRQHFGGTFGVMQPTGHRFGENALTTAQYGPHRAALIDRVAGSPWLGREWCLRAHQGRGPMLSEFFHMFGDEALQCVATEYGRFWQRRDLLQFHNHWGLDGDASKMPEFMQPMNAPAAWTAAKAQFDKLKAAGWPGCAPLPAKEIDVHPR